MGTHRRYKHHTHKQAMVSTATAGGLLVTAISIVEDAPGRSAASVPLAGAFAATQTATTADAEDEGRRRTGQLHRFDRDDHDQPRASRGKHARPQLAKAATPSKRASVAAKQAQVSNVPVNGAFRVTSTYAGHAPRMKGHVGGGIDYAVPTGTPVYATHAGKVLAAGRSGSGYGTWVNVDYGRGYQAVFAHLSRAGVQRGDVVRAGELLGRSGSTGNSTGPHLHYELRRNGASIDPRKVDLSKLGGESTSSAKTVGGSPKTIARILIDSSAQFGCFDKLTEKESSWNPRATNRSSGAYGLPQALPASKMASAGKDWRTNPTTQIRWAIGYMEERYGSPCGAWRFWQSRHWY